MRYRRALFAWVFKDFLANQVHWAIRYPADWGHTLAIPFISASFVWMQREKLLKAGFRTTWIGLLPLILGIAIYMLSVFGPPAGRHHNIWGAGFTIALFGLTLLFCGFLAMRDLFFPLVYMCLFGQYISTRLMNAVTYDMQDIAAKSAYYGLLFLGFDVDRGGNTIQIFAADGHAIPLNIAEACSGCECSWPSSPSASPWPTQASLAPGKRSPSSLSPSPLPSSSTSSAS